MSASTGAAQAWSSRPAWPVWGVVATSTSVYVSGDGAGGHVAAYTTSGTRRWVRQTDGGVQAIALVGSQLYAGGHFDQLCVGDSAFSGTSGFVCPTVDAPRRKLLALDAATGATDPWAPGANSPLGVFALRAASGALLVGGDFTAIGHLPGKTALLPRQGAAVFR